MKASAITPRAVDWLWAPYVPLGKLTAVAGQMGQGKSLWTLWLAAAVTRGDLDCPLGSAIVFSAEDDAADTTRPRIEAADADLERVWIESDGSPFNLELLDRASRELENVRLVVIDPLQAYLAAGVDAWKGQHVRSALDPLRRYAGEHGIAVVLVQHLNRRSDVSDPLARIADSQGVPQLARSVLVWGPDPADADGDQGSMKALARAKGNLARAAEAATFEITERRVSGLVVPSLRRGAERAIGADELVSDSEARTKMTSAVEWLQQLLANGPLSAADLKMQARAAGIADTTLQRAKRRLGVVSEQTHDGSRITGWTWGLPPKKNEHLDYVGHVDPLVIQERQGRQGSHISNPPARR